MTNPDTREQARHRALADPTRRRILRILEDLAAPIGVEALAGKVRLHANTVRAHLDRMEEAGLVAHSFETRSTPGRPKLLYTRAVEDDFGPPEGYRLLAEMLTTSLRAATDDPSLAAEKAGREWGRHLTGSIPPNQVLSGDEVVARITEMMERHGFDPEARSDEARTVIDLGNCPFRELAKEQANVVCALHLGMLKGSVEAMGGSASVESLEPFVEPSLCRTILRNRELQ